MTRVLKHLRLAHDNGGTRATRGDHARVSGPVKSQGNAIKNCDTGPAVSATPELDSAFLFGSGILGAAGYVARRIRARRRD